MFDLHYFVSIQKWHLLSQYRVLRRLLSSK
jgi:hypothetical protein